MNSAWVDVEDERGFTGDIDQSIRLVQKKIAAGEMVEDYEAYLQELQEVKTQQPNYAEGEPPGLPTEVYERIYYLKRMVREVKPKTPETDASEVNVNAVLEAYRTGKLEIKPGMVSYWVDGVQISRLVPRDLKRTLQIAEEHQGSAFWEEKPSVETCFAALSVPPSNAKHMLREYFFTGTAPDGQGNLVVSTNKTGIVLGIPAVQPP